jgi:uncharacterized membrane protein
MHKTRQDMSESRRYPSDTSFHTGQPSRLLGGMKKYALAIGCILAVIMAVLFVLAFKLALIITGIVLIVATVIAAYTYIVRKF